MCTARLGPTPRLLLWRAPDHQRSLLEAQSLSCPLHGAPGSWSEILSSGIPTGDSQTPSSWLQGSMSEFKVPDREYGLQPVETLLQALWSVPPGVGSLTKRGSTPLVPSQALCSVSIQEEGQNQVRCCSHTGMRGNLGAGRL